MSPVAEPSTDTERESQVLEIELKRLEAEYNMFFAGAAAAPAVGDTRPRRRARASASTACGSKTTASVPLQHASITFCHVRRPLGSRLRAREEGRPGPFASSAPRAASRSARPWPIASGGHHVPRSAAEMDKLHELYESVAEARSEDRPGRDPVSTSSRS
jgi:hypothetical protein